MALLRVTLALLVLVAAARAQEATPSAEETPASELASKPPVAITFTPPPLAGRIVLGIFRAGGPLVRTLRFAPDDPALRIDTNGYVVQWDGRDETGAPCPAGRYAARGYVVGDVSVEGEAFHFNDWMAEDRIPATGVKLLAWPDAVGVELTTAAGARYAQIAADGTLAVVAAPPAAPAPPVKWIIVEENGEKAVVLPGADGEAERRLRVPREDPQPVEVLATPDDQTILLREGIAGGGERVRMLHRAAAREEQDGAVVADWEVVFERELRPAANFGLVDGKLTPDAGARPTEITVPLVENPLEPGSASLRLRAGPTNPGSALFAPGDLPLLEISGEGTWTRFAILAGAKSREATVYQGDGLVVEEFALRRLDQIAAFDAGSFLLAAAEQ